MTETMQRPPSRGAGSEQHDDEPARLVAAAASGDPDAWNALVARFSGLVWAVIRSHRLSASDAADVAQTTWLRLVEHLERVNDPARIGAWLATTARRESLRTLRLSRRQIPCGDDLPEPDGEALDIDDALLRDERDRELWDAFGRLAPRDQALLRMLSADPAPSYREIAAALAMPVGSIGPTRARCLERLRREWAGVGESAVAACALGDVCVDEQCA